MHISGLWTILDYLGLFGQLNDEQMNDEQMNDEQMSDELMNGEQMDRWSTMK